MLYLRTAHSPFIKNISKKTKQKQQQRCEHIIRKNKQIKSTVHDANNKNEINKDKAPSEFDVKSFPRQSRSRGGGIATVYKSTFGSNITFKTNFDFTHASFEVVQASITLQHNTLHFFCLYRPPPNRRNNLTDSTFTEQLLDLLDYANNPP